MKRKAIGVVNRALAPFGVELKTRLSWDQHFSKWLQTARKDGRDPNDVGDEAWGDPTGALERYYFPYISPEHTVLELGPGSGRYTRHVIKRCKEMVLVDASAPVCDWMKRYLPGKGAFQVVHAPDWLLTPVADDSVDFVFANGVFEHLDIESFVGYFRSFRRVMKPGGKGVMNFNTTMSDEGLEWLEKTMPHGSGRSVFRFFHPETVERLLVRAGLEVEKMESGRPPRFCYVTFRRPA